MTEEFVTFQRFSNMAEALELLAILKDNGIAYSFEDGSSSNFHVTFTRNEFENDFRVKLKPSDFEKADLLLQQIYTEQINAVPEGYYLLDFTREELHDVLKKRDEWSVFDFLLAQKLLQEQGEEVKPKQIETLAKERLDELSQNKGIEPIWTVLGYVAALLGIGFVVIVFLAWRVGTHKKVLPNGEKVHTYSRKDRNHAARMLVISVLCLIFWTIKFFSNN